MADKEQNQNIVRPARNKPEQIENSSQKIGEAGGWVYILIATMFDLLGVALNLIPAIGQVAVIVMMLFAYLFFAIAFFIFSGVNVLSSKYRVLFLGSMIIELIPGLDALPATWGMTVAIINKSRTEGGALSLVSDVKTLATSKITRGKGSTKTSAFIERARSKGGDKLARSAQTRVALKGIKSNLKNRAASSADGFGGNVAKSALNRVTRSKRNPSQERPSINDEQLRQNKVLNLSNRNNDTDGFSKAA